MCGLRTLEADLFAGADTPSDVVATPLLRARAHDAPVAIGRVQMHVGFER